MSIKYREAIAQATLELMQRDDRVLVLGEGVCDPKHIFGTTALAHEAFPDRVIETPLSENMLTGALAGLALEGWKPIYVHARTEFSLLGMEHLVNTITKWPDLHNGQKLPILIRMLVGRGWGQGPTHSQSLHGMFTQIPGLRVWYPVHAQSFHIPSPWFADYRTAGPVVLLEPRRVYDLEGVLTRPCLNPTDVVLMTVGDIVIDAEDARQILDREYDIQARIHAIESLWDMRRWAADVPTVLCDSTSWHYAVFLAGLTHGTTTIVAPPNTPCPTAPDLEAAWYPTADDIVNAALRLLGRPERVPEQQETPAPDMERVTQPF